MARGLCRVAMLDLLSKVCVDPPLDGRLKHMIGLLCMMHFKEGADSEAGGRAVSLKRINRVGTCIPSLGSMSFVHSGLL